MKEKPAPCLHLAQPASEHPSCRRGEPLTLATPQFLPTAPALVRAGHLDWGRKGRRAAGGEGAQGHRDPAHVTDSSLWASYLLHVVRLCGPIPAYEHGGPTQHPCSRPGQQEAAVSICSPFSP